MSVAIGGVDVDFARLSVVVPAFNEQDSIAEVIRDLGEHLPGCEVLVVDDCSTDATADRAASSPAARVIRLPYNHGYGAALRQGILASSRDWVAWFDADNEHRASDLAAMVRRLNAEKLAAVFGARSASVNHQRSLGKMLIRVFAVLLGLGHVRDFNCGLRVFQRSALARILFLLPTGYSASTTSTFLIIRQRVPYAFEPITVRPRVGESKVRLSDGFRTLLSVLRVASLLQPLRLFGFVALLLGTLGVAYSAVIMFVNHQGLPALGVVLMLASLLIMGIAIIADQLSQFRIQHSVATGLSLLFNQEGRPNS